MNTDRFKFRVWDHKEHQYFNDPGAASINEDGILLVEHWDRRDGCFYSLGPEDYGKDRYTIEQCTGLKDKNDKLIYEGDVIRVFNACEECNHEIDIDTGIGYVVWLESHGIFYVTGKDSPENSIYDLNFNDYHFEIIGNIHDEKWGIEK